ncbi:exosortase C-terminal domain/associated protein EpsI [Desulfurivibrio sp. D14AmB]|uniref:exosortase C-terminal domain/associated protein EpsI n=1 Tax=Desulfurivibrio sp. D14AmB TaxID=3374370 RepID=UPI00376F3E42
MGIQHGQRPPGLVSPHGIPFHLLPALIATVLLATGAWLGMASVFAWIHQAWWSFAGVGVYSHGYMVLGMAVWMGWTHWQRNPPLSLAPNWWMLAPLFILVGLLSLMELLYINSSRVLLVPPLILAVTGLAFGGIAGRRLAMPVLYLYFGLLPFWILDPLLQAIATRVVGAMIALVGVTAYIEGNFIHVTAGVFEIASACSGLSFFLSALALAVFYSALYLRRWGYRLLVVAVSVGAAVVSNWIRIWTLVLIGNYTDIQHYLIRDHYLYGWVLFVVAMAPVLFFANWLTDRELAGKAKGTAANGRSRGQGAKSPGASACAGANPTPAVTYSTLAAAAIGALLLLLPRAFVPNEIHDPNASAPLPLPDHLGVIEQVAANPAWQPSFSNAREGRASYPWQDSLIHVYRAVYPQQDRGHHLFQRGNSLVGKNWQPVSRNTEFVRLNSEGISVVEYRGHIAGREHLVWAWYEVAGQPVTSRLQAKLAEAMGIMPEKRNEGVAIALSIECGLLGCDDQRELLRKFTQTSLSAIQWRTPDPFP